MSEHIHGIGVDQDTAQCCLQWLQVITTIVAAQMKRSTAENSK